MKVRIFYSIVDQVGDHYPQGVVETEIEGNKPSETTEFWSVVERNFEIPRGVFWNSMPPEYSNDSIIEVVVGEAHGFDGIYELTVVST